MAVGVVMPKAGISVESCIMGMWHVKPGDVVAVGDILFDYETDKASFECESTADGTLLEIFFESGDEVECLINVCAVGSPGDDVSGLRPGDNAAAVKQSEPIMEVEVPEQIIRTVTGSELTGAVSPRARNLAERMKVDVNAAIPSGPRGRIIERDILVASESAAAGEGFGGRGEDGFISVGTDNKKLSAVLPAVSSEADYIDEKMTQIRKVIAKSMTKSLTELAQLTNHHSCDATAMLNLRRRFKDNGGGMGLNGISLNDMVLFAAAKTLLAHPDLNAHLLNGDILRKFSGVHLGMAVDTPRGLMVPTIFNADKMSLAELSQTAKELAEQAKSGSISPDLLQGASFTVSNLGVLGVEMFTPVINPPQVAILGVCGTTSKVKEINGKIEIYQSMGLSLTYDHRAVDGAPASRFAKDLGKNLENIDLLLAL